MAIVKDLNEAVAPVSTTSVMKLLSISGPSLPTAEQRAKYTDPSKVRASMVIEWEPLSYVLDSPWGNVERVTIPVTFNLDPEQEANVAALGFNGIPNNKLIRKSSGKTARQPFDFFLRRSIVKIGIDEDGKFATNDIGNIYDVENIEAAFPQNTLNERTGKWENKGAEWTTWLKIPTAQHQDYVIPEDRPVRIVSASDDTVAATTTVASGNSGPSVDVLKTAVETVGLVGQPIGNFDAQKAQLFIMSNGAKAPIFMSAPVLAAAKAGEFVGYLVAQGAIGVEDGVIVSA